MYGKKILNRLEIKVKITNIQSQFDVVTAERQEEMYPNVTVIYT